MSKKHFAFQLFSISNGVERTFCPSPDLSLCALVLLTRNSPRIKDPIVHQDMCGEAKLVGIVCDVDAGLLLPPVV